MFASHTVSRRFAQIFALAAAVLGLLFTTAFPAGAATRTSSHQNVAMSTCLDDSYDFGVRGWSCNGMNYQLWTAHDTNGSASLKKFQNVNTGRCLAFYQGAQYPSVTGCASTTTQIFTYTNRPNNTITIRPYNSGGTCLDLSGAGLRWWSCNNYTYQDWRKPGW